jgi:hypothetical protein
MNEKTSWVLVDGSLTIPGTGIEIRQGEHPDMPYTLHSPVKMSLSYWTLDSAKADGEKLAKEAAEFK